jgi:RNA polymerase sigma-70 factor, ECF subfamily
MGSVEGYSLALSSMDGSRAEVDLAELVETYSPVLFRVVHSVLRSRAEAEDAVQDVFVRVLEHRRTLATVRNVRVWLIRIAWNLALDRRRRIRPDQFDEGFADGLVAKNLPVDEALNEARQIRAVLRELERLPRAERDVLLLAAIEELGTAEMAEVLGRSESAVRALLFRARTRLRERLGRGDAG